MCSPDPIGRSDSAQPSFVWRVSHNEREGATTHFLGASWVLGDWIVLRIPNGIGLPFPLTMRPMLVEDLGRRITAARAYRGMDLASLADAVGITTPALTRLEAGMTSLSDGDQWALLQAVASATRLPEQFFTVDFESLPLDESPERALDRLERKVDEALARMDEVVREAEEQMYQEAAGRRRSRL